MCIDIVDICLGIAHGQISSIFNRVIYLQHDNYGILSFHVLFRVGGTVMNHLTVKAPITTAENDIFIIFFFIENKS